MAPDVTDDAWLDYRRAIEGLRTRLLALDCASVPGGREAADAFLLQAEAAAYNLVIAPDPGRPRMLTQTVFLPGTYDWMLPNPDFLYRYLFVNGARAHRLNGVRGSSHFLEAQGIAGFFGDPAIRLLDTHDLDAFVQADRRIDAIIGPERPSDHDRWIRTEPGRMTTIVIREAFYDWTAETGAELEVQPLDTGPALPSSLRSRLAAAVNFIEFAVATFGPEFCQQIIARAGENAFLHVDTSRDQDAANPNATYLPGSFMLKTDELLLLSFDLPAASYWSIHLADRWSRTFEYADRQTSLNGHQADIEQNGLVHIIVSAQDPGVVNWLDTGGASEGMMLLRWYRAERVPVPHVCKLPIDRIAAQIPSAMRRITPEARAQQLAARRASIGARYRQ